MDINKNILKDQRNKKCKVTTLIENVWDSITPNFLFVLKVFFLLDLLAAYPRCTCEIVLNGNLKFKNLNICN